MGKLAWKRFLKKKIALASLILIGVSTLVAILGYLISPDQTPYANAQNLSLATRKPGFQVTMLKVRKNEAEESKSVFSCMLFGRKSKYQEIPVTAYSFRNDSIFYTEYQTADTFSLPVADVAFALNESHPIESKNGEIRFVTVDGIQKSFKTTDLYDFIRKNNIATQTYWLGTDRYGHDVLSQLIIGTRVSLSVGLISVLISLAIGIILGAIAGYFGGRVDDLIVWFINVVWAVPTLLLVIAITFVLGKGFWQIFVAVGLTAWVDVARVVRGQMMGLREKEFSEAAKALGFSNGRIIFKHLLPNTLAAVIVISAANFASAILLEAGLSFLGIGVQPPVPSWGSMIKENYGYSILDYSFLAIFPGVAIMLLVLAFMLIGNALRDSMDVKSIES